MTSRPRFEETAFRLNRASRLCRADYGNLIWLA
jgi:hypothetical protein